MSSLSKGLLGDSEETPQARLERASWHVQDAMHGMERTMPRRTRLSRHAAAVKLYLNPLLPWLAFALLVLSAFEPPYWCRKIELATHGDARLCGHPNYPSWMLSPPSPFIANAIESVVLLLFLLNVVLSTIRYGVTRAGVAADPNRAVNAVIVTAAICDALFPLAVPHATPYFRAALQASATHRRSASGCIRAASMTCGSGINPFELRLCMPPVQFASRRLSKAYTELMGPPFPAAQVAAAGANRCSVPLPIIDVFPRYRSGYTLDSGAAAASRHLAGQSALLRSGLSHGCLRLLLRMALHHYISGRNAGGQGGTPACMQL
jgi:hypothetical protein